MEFSQGTSVKSDIVQWAGGFDDLEIFIDEQLDPTRPPTAQLRETVRACGLLLIIMSKRYLQSTWCKDEIEWFEDEVRQRQADSGLVLVVRAQPTEQRDWPDCLKDERGHVVLGFQFHPDSKAGDEVVHPYGWPEPQPSDRPYFEALAKLSNTVTRRLREIRARNEEKARASQPRIQITIEGKPQIYLQSPVAELEVWQTTKRELEGAGCKVLPRRLPQAGEGLKAVEEARRQRLQILLGHAHGLCFLRIHGGNGVDREIETIVTDRSALQLAGKDLPCAVLNRAGDDLPQAKELGIDIIDATGDEWLLNFQGWLQRALKVETT
jgi:hypothetical protein